MSRRKKSDKRKKNAEAVLITDKLEYTAAEKRLDILSVIFAVIAAAALILLYAFSVKGTFALIAGIIIIVECAAFTYGSVFPMKTSMIDERLLTEKNLREVRKLSIAAKFIVTAVLTILNIIF